MELFIYFWGVYFFISLWRQWFYKGKIEKSVFRSWFFPFEPLNQFVSTKPTARLNAVFLEHLHSTEVRVFLLSAAAGSSHIQMSVWKVTALSEGTHTSDAFSWNQSSRETLSAFVSHQPAQKHAEVKLHARAWCTLETWGLAWHEMHVFICVLYLLTLLQNRFHGTLKSATVLNDIIFINSSI